MTNPQENNWREEIKTAFRKAVPLTGTQRSLADDVSDWWIPKIESLLSSIYSEMEAKRREYSNDDYHDYYNQAITDSLIIIKSKME